MTSVRHLGVNLKKKSKQAAVHECHFEFDFAAIYKCVFKVSQTKKQKRVTTDTKVQQREESFYRSHLLLPRKKVLYRTMVIYCQMANQQPKEEQKYPCHPSPKIRKKDRFIATLW